MRPLPSHSPTFDPSSSLPSPLPRSLPLPSPLTFSPPFQLRLPSLFSPLPPLFSCSFSPLHLHDSSSNFSYPTSSSPPRPFLFRRFRHVTLCSSSLTLRAAPPPSAVTGWVFGMRTPQARFRASLPLADPLGSGGLTSCRLGATFGILGRPAWGRSLFRREVWLRRSYRARRTLKGGGQKPPRPALALKWVRKRRLDRAPPPVPETPAFLDRDHDAAPQQGIVLFGLVLSPRGRSSRGESYLPSRSAVFSPCRSGVSFPPILRLRAGDGTLSSGRLKKNLGAPQAAAGICDCPLGPPPSIASPPPVRDGWKVTTPS